jgi:methionyl-tRNA formyltransferase
MDMNRKVVLWCGSAANQKALANKVAQKFILAGIVIDEKKTAGKKKLDWKNKLYDRLFFNSIHSAWKKLLESYANSFPHWPDVPVCKVNNINDPKTRAFTEEVGPDVIVVSGTSLVKGHTLKTPAPRGIMNLHTGLSPYIKGGPNCTNWCIATNQWEMVGNTIMWISEGIDSGNIITTETVDIRACSSLLEAHKRVMDEAHSLYLRALDYVLGVEPPHISVPQNEISKGRLYLTKMWDRKHKAKLLTNWRQRKTYSFKSQPITIDLPF